LDALPEPVRQLRLKRTLEAAAGWALEAIAGWMLEAAAGWTLEAAAGWILEAAAGSGWPGWTGPIR
jgi:hypothetical protein